MDAEKMAFEVTYEMRLAGLSAYSPDISEGDYIEAAFLAMAATGDFQRQARALSPPASTDRDAYEGAREDLLDWKGRAQRAEARLRSLGWAGIDASEPPASDEESRAITALKVTLFEVECYLPSSIAKKVQASCQPASAAVVPEGLYAPRYVADGPEGMFGTDDLELAGKLIARGADDADDWTVTDTHDPDFAATPSPPVGEKGDG